MNKVNYQQTKISGISLIDASYQNFSFKRHYHLDYHIGLITDGEQEYYSQGKKCRIGQGQIQVMTPDLVHDGQTLPNQGFKIKIFALSPVWLTQLNKELGNKQSPSFIDNCINNKPLFHNLNMLHHLLNEPKCSQLLKDCLPIELFSKFIRRYAQAKVTSSHAIGSKNIVEMRDYLMANLDQKVGLNDLSKLCNLSDSQLLRQFKNRTGMTPYAWLSRLRLEHALVLIRLGKPCTEVAHAVGFYDQAHLVHAFKSAYGVTPSQVIN